MSLLSLSINYLGLNHDSELKTRSVYHRPLTREKMVHFYGTVIPKLKPRGKNPRFRHMKGSFKKLLSGLNFQYDLTLSRKEAKRLNSLYNKMLDEGRLTTNPMRENQWAGVLVVRVITAAYLNNLLKDGVN